MPKTLVNLDPDDKAWLDQEARRRKLPMTKLVRQAVHSYRQREQNQARPGAGRHAGAHRRPVATRRRTDLEAAPAG